MKNVTSSEIFFFLWILPGANRGYIFSAIIKIVGILGLRWDPIVGCRQECVSFTKYDLKFLLLYIIITNLMQFWSVVFKEFY